MEELWQQFSGWVVAGFFAISTMFLEMLRRQAIEDIDDLKASDSKLEQVVDANKVVLSDHETRLQLTAQNADRVNLDLSEIKSSIEKVHSRINEHSEGFNTKLDRLLER